MLTVDFLEPLVGSDTAEFPPFKKNKELLYFLYQQPNHYLIKILSSVSFDRCFVK